MGELIIEGGVTFEMFGSPYQYDPSSQLFFDAIATAGGTLTDPDKDAINTLVIDLKVGQVWNACEVIYPIIGLTNIEQSFNLRYPSLNRMIFNGSFTSDASGIKSDALNNYIGTGFDPSPFRNNAHMTIYTTEDGTAADYYEMGAGTDPANDHWGWLLTTNQNGNNTAYGTLGSYGGFDYGGGGKAFWSVAKNGSNTSFTKNAAAVGTGASIDRQETGEITIGAVNRGGGVYDSGSTRKWVFTSMGAYMVPDLITLMYNAVTDYQTKLGRQN